MELSCVREFLVLAKVCNYEEAADILYESQSSLFKHIKSLEDDLGVSLFTKNGKHIVLSPQGELFRPYAKRLEEVEADARRELEGAAHHEDTHISISAEYPISDLVMDFYEEHPDYQIDTFEGFDGSDAAHALGTGASEIAFLSNIEELDDSYEKLPFDKKPLSLIVYEGHRFEKRKLVDISELSDEGFITFMEIPGEEDPHRAVFAEADFEPKVVMTATRGDEIMKLVRQKAGIALLFENPAEKARFKGVSIVNLKTDICRRTWLCYSKRKPLSAAAEDFIGYAKRRSRWDGS